MITIFSIYIHSEMELEKANMQVQMANHTMDELREQVSIFSNTYTYTCKYYYLSFNVDKLFFIACILLTQ